MDVMAASHEGLQEGPIEAGAAILDRCGGTGIALRADVSLGAGLPGYAVQGAVANALILADGADANGAEETAATEGSSVCGVADRAG
jgi:hypothetical protein